MDNKVKMLHQFFLFCVSIAVGMIILKKGDIADEAVGKVALQRS